MVRHFSAPVGPAAGKLFTPKWFYHDRTWTDWAKAVDWIGRNTPQDAVIATVSPHYCYLKTGRLSVMSPMEADPEKARTLLEGVPVSHVIVDELVFADISRRYTLPSLKTDPDRWRLAFQENGTSVYENVQWRKLGRGTGNASGAFASN